MQYGRAFVKENNVFVVDKWNELCPKKCIDLSAEFIPFNGFFGNFLTHDDAKFWI